MPGERTFRCIACGRVLVVDPKVRRPAAVCICAECVLDDYEKENPNGNAD